MADVYDIDFEAGNFSEFDADTTGGADLYVSTTDAITGTYSCNHDWSAAALENVSNSTSIALPFANFRVACRLKIKAAFDFGGISSGRAFFEWWNGSVEYSLRVAPSGANTIIEVFHSGGSSLTGTVNVDDGAAHTVEFRAIRSSGGGAGDGTHGLYIDGSLDVEDAAVDNDTEFTDIRIGAQNWRLRTLSNAGGAPTGGVISDDWLLRVDDDTQIYPPTVASTNQFTAAPMKKPADIDGDGDFVYIAVLNSLGFPVLIQFATALTTDGSVVFNPGAGDNIGVECSRGDGDEITVGGQFDGTNVVERSEDAGVSFSVIDDATIGGIGAFKVGPDSDNRILVFDEDNGDLLETIDEGSNWTSINASVSQTIKAMARLGVNVQEAVFGTSSADTAQVLYSINSGDDLEDLEDEAFGADVDVNGAIIN